MTDLFRSLYMTLQALFYCTLRLDLQYTSNTEQDPRSISLQWNLAQQSKPVFGTEGEVVGEV